MSVTTISAQTATASRILDGSSIRVLLLEGAAQSEGTQQLLEHCGYRVDRVSTPAEADAKLRSGAFDLLLAEAELLTSRGPAVRRLLKRAHPVPLLLIQSAGAEHRQVMHGIKLGAADILMRPLCQQKLRTVWLHCVRQELKCLSLKDNKHDQAIADPEAEAQDLDSIFAACAAQPWGPSSPIMCTSSDGSPTSSSPRCVLQQGNSLFTDTLDSASLGRKQRGVSPAPADAAMRAESPPAPPAPVSTVLPQFGLPMPIPAPVKVGAPAAVLVPSATTVSSADAAKPSHAKAMVAQPLSMPALAAVLASLPMPPVSKPAAASVSPAATVGGGSSTAGTRMPATASSAATPATAMLATAQSAAASVSDASRSKRKSAEILRKPSAAAMATASTLRKAASTAATSAATMLSGSSSAALSAAMASTMALSGLGGLGMSMGMGMAGLALPSYLQPPLPSGQVWGTPINPQAQAPGICPPALPPPTGPVPAWGLMPWMPTSLSLPGMPSMPAGLGSLMSMPFLGGGGIGSAASMMMPGLFPSPPVLPSVATPASAPAALPASGAAAPAVAAVPVKVRSLPLPSAVPAAAPAATLAAVLPPPAAPVQPPPAQPLSMMALMQVAASCNNDASGEGDVIVCPRRRSTDAAAAATAAYGGCSGSTGLGHAEQMLCLGLAEEDCDLFDFGPEMMAGSRQKVPRFGSQLNLPSLEDLMEPDVQEVMAEVMSYSQHQLSSSQISSSHLLHHGSSSHPAQAYAHTLTAPSELCTSSAYSSDPSTLPTLSDGGYCPPSRHHSMHGGMSDGCCTTGGYLPRGDSCSGLLGGPDAGVTSHACYLPNVTSYDCLSALGEEDVEAEAVAFVGKADDSDGGVFGISVGHAGSMLDAVDSDAGMDACMSAAAHDNCGMGLTSVGFGGGCDGQLGVEEQPCFLKRVDSCSFDGCGDVDVFTAGTENDIISNGGPGGSGAGVCGFVGRIDSFTGLGLSLKKSDSLLHLLNGALEVAV